MARIGGSVTQTHAGAYVAQRIFGWPLMGPRVSGPKLEYGGILGPCERRKGLRRPSLLNPLISTLFLHVGLCSLFFFFGGDVAACSVSDEIMSIKAR